MQPVTATPANMMPSAANTAADDVLADCKNLSDPIAPIKVTQAEGNLEVSRNQAVNISTPSTGVWSSVDNFLNPLERISSAVQGKYENLIQKVVKAGNQGSLAANVVSLAEPMLPVTGKIGTGATNVNLVMTGLQGFLAGVKEHDIVYGLFKLADALMFMVPRELQLGMRIGPGGYNIALATRQENNIKAYSSFSEGIRMNLERVKDYFKNLGKFGLLDGYKRENADESKAFTVGGPLQSFVGSSGMILSYLPFIPDSIKNVLRSAGYLSRLAGAITINFSEAMSKHAQSQFSGAAKMDFLAGDILDLMNKAAKITKHTLVNNMKMPENSMPVRIATVLQSLFKNSTQAAGSLGRVVSARGVEAGLTEEKYKTVGFRGILSKWMESHMDALLGIRAKGTAVGANAIVPAQLKAGGAADKLVAGSNSKVSSARDNSSREGYSYHSSSSRGASAETAYGIRLKPSVNPSTNVSELGASADINPSANVSELGANADINPSANVSELGAKVDVNIRDFIMDELLDTNLVNK